MMTFPTRWRAESDNWSRDGSLITDDSKIEAIKAEFRQGPIIVEHSYYRGGSAPSRHVFEEWEDFESYLIAKAHAGDAIDVWSFSELCKSDKLLAEGKCPAEDGTVPRGGPY
jgi:hypothetical protein